MKFCNTSKSRFIYLFLLFQILMSARLIQLYVALEPASILREITPAFVRRAIYWCQTETAWVCNIEVYILICIMLSLMAMHCLLKPVVNYYSIISCTISLMIFISHTQRVRLTLANRLCPSSSSLLSSLAWTFLVFRLLLLNRCKDLLQILYGCSLGGPLLSL